MAGFAMNKALLSLAFALSLAACGPGASNSADQGALAGASIGGPFTLTNQDGQRVTWDSFKGKYRLVYFGYTYCPDVCPVDLQHIMQGFAQFRKSAPDRAAKVQPIFISVDPDRDTPDVLKTYVTAFDPALMGLTGTPDEIAKVAKEFVVIYNKEKPEGDAGYLVSHSRTPYLFGPDGEPIALIPVGNDTQGQDAGGPAAIAATLDHWVK